MSMMIIRLVFAVAAVYDILIGLVFFFAGPSLFEWSATPVPNHWGYIQFAAMMLVIFGLMFVAVAVDPIGQRNLIRYGLLLKLSYCGLAIFYWCTSGLPMLFKPFIFFDAVMYGLFLASYLTLGKTQTTYSTETPR